MARAARGGAARSGATAPAARTGLAEARGLGVPIACGLAAGVAAALLAATQGHLSPESPSAEAEARAKLFETEASAAWDGADSAQRWMPAARLASAPLESLSMTGSTPSMSSTAPAATSAWNALSPAANADAGGPGGVGGAGGAGSVASAGSVGGAGGADDAGSGAAGASLVFDSVGKQNFYDLVFVTPSHWSEVARRCAVRASWRRYFEAASPCDLCRRYRVAAVFLIGNMVPPEKRAAFDAEADLYGDIFALPAFEESQRYKQRSLKTLHSLRYVVDHYNFSLVMKVDTDSYVFAERLLQKLEEARAFDPGQALYVGNFRDGKGAKVVTHKTSTDKKMRKWVDDTYTNLTGLETYPTHAKGPGYLMSYSIAKYLAHPDLPFKNFTCEDTAIGTYLMGFQHRKVELAVHLSATGCNEEYNKKFGAAAVDHYVEPHVMRQRYRRHQALGSPCAAEPEPLVAEALAVCEPMGALVWVEKPPPLEAPAALLSERPGVCRLRLSWRSTDWGPCIATSGILGGAFGGFLARGGDNATPLGLQWRCLQCFGDDVLYDDVDCVGRGPAPPRSKPCVPDGDVMSWIGSLWPGHA